MAGEDLSSSVLAPAPREALAVRDITPAHVRELGVRVAQRTWEVGLPSWSWGEGVCLLGLTRVAEATGEPFPSAVLAWLDRHLEAGVSVDHVNDVAPGIVAALATRRGAQDYLAQLRPMAEWALTAATRAPNGAIEHWPAGVWADTTFMAGVFLGQLGAASGETSLIEECGRQVVAHAEILQDPETGLIAHGSHRGETVWSFWGRANAWFALAAVEFLELAAGAGDVDTVLVDGVQAVLRRQLRSLAALQPEHGVWDVLVDGQPENVGILETSAAAGLAAAILRADRVVPDLPPEVERAGWRAARGSLAYVDVDGTLARTSAGTVLQLVPFGYSVIRDDRVQPWGQGLALHAIAVVLERLGRGDVAR